MNRGRSLLTFSVVVFGLLHGVTSAFSSSGWLQLPLRHHGVCATSRHVVLNAVDVDSMVSVVDNFYRSSPVEAAALTCGIKASCSDAISQRGVERDHPFCWSRNVAFILYGSLYQGVTQHFIFNELYPIVFGSGTDFGTVAEKVLFDQLVITPFLCLPVAYLVKAAVFDRPLRSGIDHYIADAKKDLLWKYWAIWTPAQCLTFSVVPEHLRIPFIALVSFFWLILLSSISSRPQVTAPGKNIICYDNECIVVDEIDDPVDFPQYYDKKTSDIGKEMKQQIAAESGEKNDISA